jgi:hypothetical protein
MGRKCCVCSDGRRDQIERALLSGTAFRYLSKRFGISAASLLRHKADHLPRTLVKAHEVAEVTRSGGLLRHVQTLVGRTESLYQQAEAILSEAKADGDKRTALAALREATIATREARGHLELLGKLSGELENSSATVNIQCVVLLPPAPASTTDVTVVEAKILPESERSPGQHH